MLEFPREGHGFEKSLSSICSTREANCDKME